MKQNVKKKQRQRTAFKWAENGAAIGAYAIGSHSIVVNIDSFCPNIYSIKGLLDLLSSYRAQRSVDTIFIAQFYMKLFIRIYLFSNKN